MMVESVSTRWLRTCERLLLAVSAATLLCTAMVFVSNAASGPQLWRAPTPNKIDELRRLEELSQIAEGLRAAVLRKDPEPLLKYYWRDAEKSDPSSGAWGLPNADGTGTYESEKALLANPASASYCLLFDTACLRSMALPERRDDPGFRLAVRDFFLSGPVTTEIFFQVSPDGAGVDLDRAVLVYVRAGSPSGKFSRLQDFERAVDKWADEFLWVQIALTRFGWRYEQAVFVFPYDTD